MRVFSVIAFACGFVYYVVLYASKLWPALILLFAFFIAKEIIFWCTHRRPLSDEEVKSLSEARRCVEINKIFQFTHNQVKVNPTFRSSLDREGRWDKIDVELNQTPALITEMLRYKRHEWSIWCLTNEQKCKFLWANKGDDNESCYFKGSIPGLISLATHSDCNTVIHFHNHPHTADRTWNLLSPSDQDMRTLKAMSETFENGGLNYISALCSQGKYIIYGSMFYSGYYPPGTSMNEVRKENDVSEKQNYRLHKELRKIKKAKIKRLQ